MKGTHSTSNFLFLLVYVILFYIIKALLLSVFPHYQLHLLRLKARLFSYKHHNLFEWIRYCVRRLDDEMRNKNKKKYEIFKEAKQKLRWKKKKMLFVCIWKAIFFDWPTHIALGFIKEMSVLCLWCLAFDIILSIL